MALFDKPLFIFEMANNHQGSVEHGKKIIREMKHVSEPFEEIFNFAVKFQYRNLDTFIHPDYRDRDDVKNVKRFKDTRLNLAQFEELKKEVEQQGMYTICTPFDENSVQNIVEQGYDAIKIASCSFTDWPLLETIAASGKTVIASAAGSSMEDVERVVNFFKHRHITLALMHCIAEYPTLDDNLEMNQITLYKKHFPGIPVGFSTHENPDDVEPVKLAVAKGAVIFEKHVGVETDTIKLNGYSARPDQVEKWIETAAKTFRMCGVEGVRYQPLQKERDDLAALQRGVFAKREIAPGTKVNMNDIYLAFPCEKGQVLASQLSKYNSLTMGLLGVKPNEPLMLAQVSMKDDLARIHEIVRKIMCILKKSNVMLPIDSTCEISHHYGLEHFEETGVTLIDCINREYCKKILVVLPGQYHPVHLHKQKEETFMVIYGTLNTVCNGEKKTVLPGEAMVVERGAAHSFGSDEGCVFEEISTTHYGSDSYYEKQDEFVNPRKTKVYITKEMLDEMQI